MRHLKIYVTSIPLTLALCCFHPMLVSAETSMIANEIQQQQKISGHVVDESGDPLVGVTVVVKDTKVATVTDADGNFTLPASKSTGPVVFSYVGYLDKIVPIGRVPARVVMKQDTNLLDEVVSIGYGTMKKRDLTGAISTVKNDLIKLTPSSNPMESLQGRVAGLDITKSSGQAGAGINMQLRGNRSITASGSPLFIIDGLPGDYSTLNPNDIETIEVLKDASSTAVYGSSGSNGVVIITTRKGEDGKMNINFDAYLGINGWSTMPKMNDAYQYVYTQTLASKEAGTVIDDFEKTVTDGALARGEIVNWADALLHTGTTQNYSLSLSGGTQRTKAYFSVNYSQEDGQLKGDKYRLLSSTTRVSHQIRNWLEGGIHIQASYTKRDRAYSKLDQALRAAPFGKLYKEDGSINEYPITDDNKQVNLLLNENSDVYENNPNQFKLYVQPYLKIQPIKGLTLETRLSASISYSTTNEFVGYGSYQFYDQAGTGALTDPSASSASTSASISNNRSWGYEWENILTYNFQIARDHDFTFTGVTTYSDYQNESSSSSVTGLTSNTYKWYNLNAAIGTKSVGSGYSMGKGMGYVGRLSYSYLGRYLFSASVRYDGNSKLAKDVRWNAFPAFSAGWRISDEEFMANTQDWLSSLKLRAGYGETGAAGISAYDSQSVLQQGNMGLGNKTYTSYYFPQNLSNAELTWERSKNWNFGIDASFLNNRIELNADYYLTRTSGVIWKQNMPITNGGFSSTTPFTMVKNIAETKNHGLELTLNTRNIQTRAFTWTSTLTFTSSKEKVTSLGDGAADFISNGDYTLTAGSPIRSYRAFKIDGVWQYGEESDAAVFGKKPGDLKVNIPNMYKKEDGVWAKKFQQDDGTWTETEYNAENPYSVSADDKQIIGHENPDWSLGFQNTFTYKGFDLNIYMFWRHGQMFYYDPITWYSSTGGAFPSNFDYWTSTNPSNDFPALNSSRNWKADEYYTSLAYVDGSFFKIKNITLGYTLPVNICKKIGLNNLRVYGTITNPLVHSSCKLLKNYDPEQMGSLDYPLTKQLVFGVSVSL